MRILVADDEPTSREILTCLLEKWGYEVVAASDGWEAWRALRRPDAPSLAILDWVMPGMEGPEICRRLRCQEEGRYTYILLLTVMDSQEDIVGGIYSGADDYIVKPFEPEELRARLNVARRHLDVHQELLAARRRIRELAGGDGPDEPGPRQAGAAVGGEAGL